MSEPAEPLPTATFEPHRGGLAPWLIPLATLAFAAFLGWRAWAERGTRVEVRFAEGHGIEAGDAVRFRGIAIGEIEDVGLDDARAGVVVGARLEPGSGGLARAGTRFWVVRPRIGLSGVEGIETLFGARYLTLVPGPADAERLEEFVGLEEPPLSETIEPGGLEVSLVAPERGSLERGTPITWRGVRVGTVLSVELTSDATTIEARAWIQPAYAALVRSNSRFFETSGVLVDLGWLTGLSVELESVASLVGGGVGFATPDAPGEPVGTGHRFSLASEPRADWLEWRPSLPVGHSLLPPGAAPPRPVRAVLTFRDSWWPRRKRLDGWVLRVEGGLLGPVELFVLGEDVEEDTVELEVAGQRLALGDPPLWERAGIALAPLAIDRPVWPDERCRAAREPEDCLLLGDPGQLPMPLAAPRLADAGESWSVDRAVSFGEEEWHGASVVARSDGALIGVLLVDDGAGRIVPLPAR